MPMQQGRYCRLGLAMRQTGGKSGKLSIYPPYSGQKRPPPFKNFKRGKNYLPALVPKAV